MRCLSFNSKLVRLKVWQKRKNRIGRGFNSKLVRLKVGTGFASWCWCRDRFQFQTGAIKRKQPRGCQTPLQAGFNSKLVRLKGFGSVTASSVILCFNSKLVRLKGPFLSECAEQVLRFNSKLVRLKGRRSQSRRFQKSGFQFQTGAIKSLRW